MIFFSYECCLLLPTILLIKDPDDLIYKSCNQKYGPSFLLQMIASFSKLTRLNIGLNRFVNENKNYLTFYIDNFLWLRDLSSATIFVRHHSNGLYPPISWV